MKLKSLQSSFVMLLVSIKACRSLLINNLKYSHTHHKLSVVLVFACPYAITETGLLCVNVVIFMSLSHTHSSLNILPYSVSSGLFSLFYPQRVFHQLCKNAFQSYWIGFGDNTAVMLEDHSHKDRWYSSTMIRFF